MSIDAGVTASARSADRSELDVLLEFVDWVDDDLPDLVAVSNPASRSVPTKDAVAVKSKPWPLRPKVKRGEVSEVERLQKAREKERRRYYRNKNRLSSLRRAAASLERQLGSLTLVKQPSSPASPYSLLIDHRGAEDHLVDSIDRAAMASKAQIQELQVRYADLLRMKTRMNDENEQLRRHLSEASQRVRLLSKRLFAERALYMASPTSFRLLNPLTIEACASINVQRVKIVDAFKREPRVTTPSLGGSSSWREWRTIDGALFKFVTRKTYSHTSAEDACTKVWSLLSHPLCSRKLFSDVSNVRVRLVQKVDGDNFVVLEEMGSEADDGQVIRSPLLISRVTTDVGFRVHINTLDKDQIMIKDALADPNRTRNEPEREVWSTSEQVAWVEFETHSDACTVTFAGVMPTSGVKTPFWMSEAALVCLRAETAVIGARFSLHA